MRNDPFEFQNWILGRALEPRFVIQFLYTLSSPSFTSHSSLTNVPGVVLQNTVVSVSSVSASFQPEEGRSSIGNVTIKLQDTGSPSTLTETLRDQLQDNSEGLRNREVRIWVGFNDDWDRQEFWVRAQTVYVRSFQANPDGSYTVSCSDKSALLRGNVFDQKITQLNEQLGASETTITVRDASEFQTIAHTSTFSDSPSATVGYFLIEKTGEIVKYTGKSGNDFTGCTRGALGTTGQRVEYDATADPERFPKVSEYIYLEMPGPQIAYAVLTGVIDPAVSPPNTLPSHWHAGLAEADLKDWTTVGADLWDQDDAENSVVLRFTGLTKTDAKKFIEREIWRLLGLFSPTNNLGQFLLKRTVPILNNAAFIVSIDKTSVISHTPLVHDTQSVFNQFRIDWNWVSGDFTRSSLFTDADSITRHGATELKLLRFKGLPWQRFTTRRIADLIAAFRDRHSEPPLRLSITVGLMFSFLEPGDVVQIDLATIQDASSESPVEVLLRSFEVQQVRTDWQNGRITLKLFASSQTPNVAQLPPPPLGSGATLPDAFYTSVGTDLEGLPEVTAGSPVSHLTSNLTLNGGTARWQPGSIWYVNNDFTIDAGVTLTITGNVTLRVMGFLTVNGDIDGTGGGKAGTDAGEVVDTYWDAVDDSDFPFGWGTYEGTPGFIGNSKASDSSGDHTAWLGTGLESDFFNVEGRLTEGRFAAMPFFNVYLPAPETEIWGIQGDLRGGGGANGGPFLELINPAPPVAQTDRIVRAVGGAGGDGGAGLLIVSRGLGFGGAGQITLNGDPGLDGATVVFKSNTYSGATGGGGAPGALVIVMDGDDLAFPTIGGNFTAIGGDVSPVGNFANRAFSTGTLINWTGAGTRHGVNDRLIDNIDLSDVAYRVQYMPGGDGEAPEDDIALKPSAPTALVVTGGLGTVSVFLTDPNWRDTEISWEVWESSTNDRAFAVEISRGRVRLHTVDRATGGVFYYWTRANKTNAITGVETVSDWFPAGATSGVSATIAQVTQTDLVLNPTPNQSLNTDPNFDDPITSTGFAFPITAAQQLHSWSGNVAEVIVVGGVTDAPIGDSVLDSGTVSPSQALSTYPIPVDRNKTYRARVIVRDLDADNSPAPDSAFYQGIAFTDINGNNIASGGDDGNAGWRSGTYWYNPNAGNIKPGSAWTIHEFTFGANAIRGFPLGAASPPNTLTPAKHMHLLLLLANGGTTAAHVQVADARIDEVAEEINIGDGQVRFSQLRQDPTQGAALNADPKFKETVVTTGSVDVVNQKVQERPWAEMHGFNIGAVITGQTDVPLGERYFQATAETWLESTEWIPIDRNKAYTVSFWLRRTTNPTVPKAVIPCLVFGDENQANIDSSGDTNAWIIDGYGTPHWGWSLALTGTLNTWQRFSDDFGARTNRPFPLGSASPPPTETIAKFMRLAVRINRNQGGSPAPANATYQVVDFRIDEKIVPLQYEIDSIPADKLNIRPTPGQALNNDPQFHHPVMGTSLNPTADPGRENWYTSLTGQQITHPTIIDITDAPQGSRVVDWTRPGNSDTATVTGTHFIPVDREKTYKVTCWVRDLDADNSSAPTGFWKLGVEFFGDDRFNDQFTGTDPASGWATMGTTEGATAGNNFPAFDDELPPSAWTYYEFTFGKHGTGAFPVGSASPPPAFTPAKWMLPYSVLDDGTGAVESHRQICDLRIEEVGKHDIGFTDVDQTNTTSKNYPFPIATPGPSIVDDPMMLDTSAWVSSFSPTGAARWLPIDHPDAPYNQVSPEVSHDLIESDGQHGRSVLKQTALDGHYGFYLRAAKFFPIDVGSTYRVSLWARRVSGNNHDHEFAVQFRDANGALNDTETATGWPQRSLSNWVWKDDFVVPTTWTQYEFYFGAGAEAIIPTTAVEACPLIHIQSDANSPTQGDQVTHFAGYHIEKIVHDRTTGTWTPTWTGFSTAPTGDLRWQIIGGVRGYVIVTADGGGNRLGTSNATAMSITGIPNAIRPNVTVQTNYFQGHSAGFGGQVSTATVSSAGTITFYTGLISSGFFTESSANWFNDSNNKGIEAGAIIMYPLNVSG